MALSPQPSIQDVNAMARAQVLANSIEMTQSIFSGGITGNVTANNNVYNFAPRNVGLIKGFIITIAVQAIVATTSSTATITAFGPANLLSQVTFTDLNNNVRIQTAGWHVNFINSAKSRRAFGSAYTNDSPIAYKSNWEKIIDAPTSIVTAGAAVTSSLYMMYYIPLAYSDVDLRGSVYANVVNATMNLQLTLNPSFFVASGDATLAGYSGVAGVISTPIIQIYQVYLDQLPQGKNGPILPPLDLSTIYELKNTTMAAVTSNNDYPIPYSNFRDFLSTIVVLDNNGTLNTGSDVNYWALQSANYTNIFKIDPYVSALKTRQEIGDDYPSGVYYFSSRNKPISTIQYGNMNLILNGANINSATQLLIGFEDFAYVNQIVNAGSLPGT